MPGCDLAEKLQETIFWRKAAAVAQHGLTNYGRNLIPMLREDPFDALSMIPSSDQRVDGRPLPHARCHWLRRTRVQLDHRRSITHQDAVVPTVIMALELKEPPSSGHRPRQS